jgi:hypothetical protein
VVHRRLVTFFTGAVDELRAAYKKSEGAPSSCAGSLRERGVRRAIEHSLPGVVRLYEGEIIDHASGQSGQLDGILVHATGTALATDADDSRIVLAEGAIAVVESKSSLDSQWSQVKATWDKLKKLRRREGYGGTIPFVVVGRQGWKTGEPIADHVWGLLKPFEKEFPNDFAPPVLVVQLEPPIVGLALWEGTNEAVHLNVTVHTFEEEHRWETLAQLWRVLTQMAMAREEDPIAIPWDKYLL